MKRPAIAIALYLTLATSVSLAQTPTARPVAAAPTTTHGTAATQPSTRGARGIFGGLSRAITQRRITWTQKRLARATGDARVWGSVAGSLGAGTPDPQVIRAVGSVGGHAEKKVAKYEAKLTKLYGKLGIENAGPDGRPRPLDDYPSMNAFEKTYLAGSGSHAFKLSSSTADGAPPAAVKLTGSRLDFSPTSFHKVTLNGQPAYAAVHDGGMFADVALISPQGRLLARGGQNDLYRFQWYTKDWTPSDADY